MAARKSRQLSDRPAGRVAAPAAAATDRLPENAGDADTKFSDGPCSLCGCKAFLPKGGRRFTNKCKCGHHHNLHT
jgi:hypothetical protein